MKIALCGSATSIERLQELQKQLEERGHEVTAPGAKIRDEEGNILSSQEYVRRYRSTPELSEWALKSERTLMYAYFPILTQADAVLIVNITKNGIPNYIGGSSFLEMSIACYLGKPIFLLNPVPQGLLYTEDILLIDPKIIHGDLDQITIS